jgi:hypothetical protein
MVRYHLFNIAYYAANRLLFRVAEIRDVLQREAEYRYDCWQNSLYQRQIA